MTDRPGTDPRLREAPPSRRGRAIRVGWLLLGFLCVGLGIIGALVPLMPTTIFLIFAAGCFTHSSPRLEAWLLNHPRHGPTLRAWRAEGAIPKRGKRAACIGMTVGYGIFWLVARPDPLLAVGVAVALLASAAWIISRPLPREESPPENDASAD